LTLKDYCWTQYISNFKNNRSNEDNSDNDGNGDDEETQSDATDLNDEVNALDLFFAKLLEHINLTSPILSELLTDTAGVPGAMGRVSGGIATSGSHFQVPPASKEDDDEYPALWM
jgi:hypothetical protein